MGNREDLLVAAKRCLYEKGYARTTARDIATAAGVSLAAIGYHYGSKEALLNAALQQAIEEWGGDLARLLTSEAEAGLAGDRFARTWTKVIDSFAATRPLWEVQFELLAHIERTPELRSTLADAHRQARLGLAELFGYDAAYDERRALRMGAFYQVLLGGLAAQWLADPAGALSGSDLLEAMRTVLTENDKTL
ncbi:TetR/AcrR family transcriptional regulator [Micromonospora sp. NBC_01638]|uniref:TetR/AcrR family transcriptional regulator n=1 Tax=Micromonospora sp. NBC_01638 TaxID=2975982 RepID=UPI00386F1699|nr:TetR/AcrR family transcriptional regulator [Micromonospora sp. NBC_01638]